MYQNKILKVFILDSNEEFRNVCKENLTNLGIDIIGECDNGQTALDMISELKPEVVLHDLWFSGLDCSRLIRETKSRMGIDAPKFILVTGVVCFKRLIHHDMSKSLKTYKATKQKGATHEQTENNRTIRAFEP